MSFFAAITANAILKGSFNNQPTYTVYFGQTFEKPIGPANSKPDAAKVLFGDTVYEIQNISDLDQIPNSFEPQEIIEHMNNFFKGGVSNVKVHSIINIVYVIRKLVTRRIANKAPTKLDSIHL